MIHSVDEESGGGGGKLSRSTKDILFGSLAGMVSKVFEHPFDLVKVRLQTQSSDRPARYAGAFDCFKQVYLTEGFKGLFRGLSMPVMGATLENACLFFTYNRIQAIIRDINGSGTSKKLSSFEAEAEAPLSIPQLAIAAAGAGSITSLVLTPIELIKCKMQVQMIAGGGQSQAAAAASSPIVSNVKLDGPVALFRQTIRENGIRGLWLGQTGTLLRETGGGIAWFLAFESSSRWLIERKKAELKRSDITKKDLGSLQLIGAGALAGISYNVVLFPADCVKSTMQTEAELRGTMNGGGKATRTGFFQTFMNIYRTRGVRGLYAGCGVTCIRSAPSSALIFLMYNKLEQAADHYGL
ncbi:putative mitochondrial ornithine carrier protein AmcA/Ort1 [Violaceomyces palustris]|uniref:Mitochondrial ornithine carrier protein AmcA/Ort1 n=1 Tax=Violaceomyces palustris TaxID=1673888 RepID=A0ACD0NTP7_9BASI|nr:putative mitochondrial ornithine carrier protein AmcA/Ort1 [Violaceomyces palustris]